MEFAALSFLSILQDVLTGVFEAVLAPALTAVFNWFVNMVGDLIWELLKDIFLDVLVLCLKMVNFVSKMFDVYCGRAYTVVISPQGGKTNMTLINYLFQLKSIGSLMMYMTLIGGALAFLFSIYATTKTITDSVIGPGSKPISKVISNGIKCCLTFMLVPIMCVFLLHFSDTVMVSIENAFGYGSGTFDINRFNQDSKNKKTNPTAESSGPTVDEILFWACAEASLTDTSETNVKNKQQLYLNGKRRYEDKSAVKKEFNYGKIDYISGYASSVLIFLILIGSSLHFIQRCFELLLLYLISPAFSATIAMDGGARFARWREQFIGKFFGAFGSVYAMRIYLLLVPLINSTDFKFSADKTMNSIIKIMFIIGGAYAVYKSESTISELLFGESANGAMGKMLGTTLMAGALMKNGVQGIAGLFKGGGGGGGGGQNGEGQGEGEGQGGGEGQGNKNPNLSVGGGSKGGGTSLSVGSSGSDSSSNKK